MSETISLEWIGMTLRELQAGQRSVHAETQMAHKALSEAIRS
jgi:hypothetical protein